MTDLPYTRMTIIALSAFVFALLFAQLVNQSPSPINRVHAGSTIPCFHPASPFCTAAGAGDVTPA